MALPDEILEAFRDLKKGLHPGKLEVLALPKSQDEALQEQGEASRESFLALVGPGHTPPPGAINGKFNVAKPAIQAAYWLDGDWQCLRIEERTVGYIRPKAYFNTSINQPALRQDPITEGWMQWIHKLAVAMGIKPLEGSVRMIVFPGLRYTFLAWCPVPPRPTNLLHPMDCDNAAKPSLDSLQAGNPPKPPKKKPSKAKAPVPEPPAHTMEPLAGAFFNDTQVVDLCVYRLPQEGKPAVNRMELHRERSKKRQEVIKSRPKKEKPGPAARKQLGRKLLAMKVAGKK